ncbi:hypothetical protein N7326_06495 [Corynebacterium sp. ES2794-CONJ1]|uniref:Rib/alpha-like domain-containing protein n=1 Tax=unclassified Corynebacterium TaxID=2624378 RepID=UPI002167DB08|nr:MULTISPECIES: Rib/alpha-like domain-containing protein [unclassified Corynebacterium]MCS4492013.1 hypothetical protein [Corynebacterium sp. ES2715-CONJ3]MCS4532118.1 hypothetical protein [Corynebacterium sp. ES2730-CONJ]MCU9519520.1 hypothetical protein [Corynebacterium sp. ES2794-CONJ1]
MRLILPSIITSLSLAATPVVLAAPASSEPEANSAITAPMDPPGDPGPSFAEDVNNPPFLDPALVIPDIVSYSLVGAPEGVDINPETGALIVDKELLRGRGDQSFIVMIRFSDGTTLDQPFTIEDTSDAPLNTIVTPHWTETYRESQSFDMQAGGGERTLPITYSGLPLDPAKFVHKIEMVSAPDWVTMKEDGTLIVNPGRDVNPGSYPVNVTVTYRDNSYQYLVATMRVSEAEQPSAKGLWAPILGGIVAALAAIAAAFASFVSWF